jgi:uncharacterized protein YciI
MFNYSGGIAMPQYLYRIQPTRTTMLSEGATPEESAIVSEHFQRLESLMEQGVVILAGRTLNTDPTSFGIIIFNAESDEVAREIMHSDPAVSGGVMRAELFPYRVALIDGENVRPSLPNSPL